MIELKSPVKSFAVLDAEIDRIEIMSISYNKHRGREAHLDIGVEVGKWIEAVTETIPVEHPGWMMVDGEDGAPPSRVCRECGGVEQWLAAAKSETPATDIQVSDRGAKPETPATDIQVSEPHWDGKHDMEACLANREPETRLISEAHVEWRGGSSVVVKMDDASDLGIRLLESAVGEFIQRLAEEGLK